MTKNPQNPKKLPTWQKVQEITTLARNKILELIKELLVNADGTKGDELRRLCNEYACKMWLAIEDDSSNPFMIRPVLYTYFDGNDAPSKMKSWKLVTSQIGEWASNLRITIKMIQEPYNGEALFNYP